MKQYVNSLNCNDSKQFTYCFRNTSTGSVFCLTFGTYVVAYKSHRAWTQAQLVHWQWMLVRSVASVEFETIAFETQNIMTQSVSVKCVWQILPLSVVLWVRGGSRSRDLGGGHICPYGESEAQVYNGRLAAVPPAGSRGSPPEAEHFFVLSYAWNGAKLLCLWAVLWSSMAATASASSSLI